MRRDPSFECEGCESSALMCAAERGHFDVVFQLLSMVLLWIWQMKINGLHWFSLLSMDIKTLLNCFLIMERLLIFRQITMGLRCYVHLQMATKE